MYFCALGEAVANYGVRYSSYCKLWGLGVADLVYWIQDKQLFCRELQLQPIGGAHKGPGIYFPGPCFLPFQTVDRKYLPSPHEETHFSIAHDAHGRMLFAPQLALGKNRRLRSGLRD